MKAKAAERAGGSIGLQTERRIGWLTVVFGFVATAVVLVLRHKLWAAGLAIGTALGWLNFRWLRRAVDALVIVSTAQADREKARVPLTAYLAALFATRCWVERSLLFLCLSSVPLGVCVSV